MFKRGDRVRLGPEYFKFFRKTRNADRLGTVVSTPRYHMSGIRVVWDGLSPNTVEHYHRKFLERAPADEVTI